MTIQNDRRKFIPAALLSVVIAVASINIALAQPTQALSLGGILDTLLGKGDTTKTEEVAKPTVSPQTPATTTTPNPTTSSSSAQPAPTPIAPATASQSAAPAQTQASVVPASVIADTAATVLATAAAQTHQVDSSVVYPSAQIDANRRDQLYAIAASVAIMGIALYGMTLIKMSKPAVMPVSRRPLLND